MSMTEDPSRTDLIDLPDFVDLVRYRLDDPESPRYLDLVENCAQQIKAGGSCELDGFLTNSGLATMTKEAQKLEAHAFRSGGLGTVYLDKPDRTAAPDHPRQYQGEYGVAAVAYDQFPAQSTIRQLYESASLLMFLGDVLKRGPLFRYADPLGALNLAVMNHGDQLQWHFDQTDFVVSLALQDADVGGDFEVVPNIRSIADERYGKVAEVLAGNTRDVITLPMTPGSLLIFEGRNSIHRVTPISGTRSRLVGLFGYDTREGTMSSETLKMTRYGRLGASPA